MNYLILTNEMIRSDLAGFQGRLQEARDKISKLPAGYLPYQEHKKREQTRRVLNDEIDHVKNLIHITNEAIQGV